MPRLLVAGPPCGGKSTYAREQLAPGEYLLDYDDLAEQLIGRRYILTPAIRKEWSLRLPDSDVVVWTAPRRTERGRFRTQFKARIVVVLASLEECLGRAERERPPDWQRAIREWFRDWEPSRTGGEVVIRTDSLT